MKRRKALGETPEGQAATMALSPSIAPIAGIYLRRCNPDHSAPNGAWCENLDGREAPIQPGIN